MISDARDQMRADIAAQCKNAFYAARDQGRTMHEAADEAANLILPLVEASMEPLVREIELWERRYHDAADSSPRLDGYTTDDEAAAGYMTFVGIFRSAVADAQRVLFTAPAQAKRFLQNAETAYLRDREARDAKVAPALQAAGLVRLGPGGAIVAIPEGCTGDDACTLPAHQSPHASGPHRG